MAKKDCCEKGSCEKGDCKKDFCKCAPKSDCAAPKAESKCPVIKIASKFCPAIKK